MFLLKRKRKMGIASYTSPGGREKNEDSIIVLEKPNKDCIAVVADGLGGQGEGQVASSEALKVIVKCFEQAEEYPPETVANWYDIANRVILDKQKECCHMMTTMVSLVISSDTALCAHVGDSRLYHFENGKLQFQSFDHSVSQMAVLSGEISKEQIRGHADRNRLLRALGRDEDVTVEISEPIDISKGEHAFLLCSDGFWEFVYEEEMEGLLKKSKTAEEWLLSMREKHKQRAKPNHDNNSAIVVLIK